MWTLTSNFQLKLSFIILIKRKQYIISLKYTKNGKGSLLNFFFEKFILDKLLDKTSSDMKLNEKKKQF